MAIFSIALGLTLQHEGGFFHNLKTGEVVNRGITLAFLRGIGRLTSTGAATPADILYIQNLTLEQTSDLFEEYWWEPLLLDHVNDQEIANKVFDVGVNTGQSEAVTLLQRAVLEAAPNAQLVVDGAMGAHTLDAVNAVDATELLADFRLLGEGFYRGIAAKNANYAADLGDWLARLAAA
jgi:lysozyme family protein